MTHRSLPTGSAARTDLIALAAVCATAVVILAIYIPRHAVVASCATLLLGSCVFSWRRWRELRLQAASRQGARARQGMSTSDERLRLLVEGVGDYAFFMLGPDGRVASWNAGAERIKGYSADEIVGRHFSCFYPSAAAASGAPARHLEMAASRGRFECEGWRVRKGGARFWANVLLTALRDTAGQLRGFSKVTHDVSQLRHAEEELAASRTEVRSLATELAVAEARERRRIAADLHDHVGQDLSAVKLRLELLQRSVPLGAHARLVEEIRELLERAIVDMWSLMFELSPPFLYEQGLAAALKWLIRQIRQHEGLAIDFEGDDEGEPLPNDVRGILFQATRELLTNVVKHARATRAKVTLRVEHGRATIDVEDDGVGCDLSHSGSRPSQDSGGFGLAHIRERLTQLGGRFELRSGPGLGTTITISAPTEPVPTIAGRESNEPPSRGN